MARINLLPWRAELRKVRQRHFFSACGLAAAAGLCAVGWTHLLHQDWISYQESRNAYLQSEIALLDGRIAEIKSLDKEKQRMIDRMHAIEDLQTSRPAIVHLLDDLVTFLPEGVYLTEFEQKGLDLVVKGVAESNARVSSFMRNLETSAWIGNPKLDVIETKDDNGRRISNFTMHLKQVEQKPERKNGKAAPKGKVS